MLLRRPFAARLLLTAVLAFPLHAQREVSYHYTGALDSSVIGFVPYTDGRLAVLDQTHLYMLEGTAIGAAHPHPVRYRWNREHPFFFAFGRDDQVVLSGPGGGRNFGSPAGGRSWQQIALGGARPMFSSMAYTGERFLATAIYWAPPQSFWLWESANGIDWTPLEPAAEGYRPTHVVAVGAVTLFVNRNEPRQTVLWRWESGELVPQTDDPVLQATFGNDPSAIIETVKGVPTEFYLVVRGVEHEDFLLRSPDGRSWMATELPDWLRFDEAVVFQDELYFFGSSTRGGGLRWWRLVDDELVAMPPLPTDGLYDIAASSEALWITDIDNLYAWDGEGEWVKHGDFHLRRGGVETVYKDRLVMDISLGGDHSSSLWSGDPLTGEPWVFSEENPPASGRLVVGRDRIARYPGSWAFSHSTDGFNWTQVELPLPAEAVEVVDAPDGWLIVDRFGNVARSLDGVHWTRTHTGTVDFAFDSAVRLPGGDILAIGIDTVYRTGGWGGAWEEVRSFPGTSEEGNPGLRALFYAKDRVWMIVNPWTDARLPDGGIMVSTDEGVTWEPIYAQPAEPWNEPQREVLRLSYAHGWVVAQTDDWRSWLYTTDAKHWQTLDWPLRQGGESFVFFASAWHLIVGIEQYYRAPAIPVGDAWELGGGWERSHWFGTFWRDPQGSGWLWHLTRGWLWTDSTNADDMWLFDPQDGWFHTTAMTFDTGVL